MLDCWCIDILRPPEPPELPERVTPGLDRRQYGSVREELQTGGRKHGDPQVRRTPQNGLVTVSK